MHRKASQNGNRGQTNVSITNSKWDQNFNMHKTSVHPICNSIMSEACQCYHRNLSLLTIIRSCIAFLVWTQNLNSVEYSELQVESMCMQYLFKQRNMLSQNIESLKHILHLIIIILPFIRVNAKNYL